MKTKIVEHLFDQQGRAEVIAERLMSTAQRLIVLISQRDPRSLGSALSLFLQPHLQTRRNGRSCSCGGWSLSNRPLPRGGLASMRPLLAAPCRCTRLHGMPPAVFHPVLPTHNQALVTEIEQCCPWPTVSLLPIFFCMGLDDSTPTGTS